MQKRRLPCDSVSFLYLHVVFLMASVGHSCVTYENECLPHFFYTRVGFNKLWAFGQGKHIYYIHLHPWIVDYLYFLADTTRLFNTDWIPQVEYIERGDDFVDASVGVWGVGGDISWDVVYQTQRRIFAHAMDGIFVCLEVTEVGHFISDTMSTLFDYIFHRMIMFE